MKNLIELWFAIRVFSVHLLQVKFRPLICGVFGGNGNVVVIEQRPILIGNDEFNRCGHSNC
ncbi:MAG: hypothetical protein LBG27_13425 [Spirochaetaceae bacterium]|nr:hypothetical protein [Spirochaetaceae bacterium]